MIGWPSPFPAGVGFAVVLPGEPADIAPWPAEAALLSPQAIERRQRTFRLGRAAARAALAAIGAAPAPVLAGPRGEPIWPPGVVGSITHTDGAGAACAGPAAGWAGLGLDLEQLDRELHDGVLGRICRPAERDWVEAAADRETRRRRLLELFAAKEATFKAFYPLEQVFLGFADAELAWDEAAGAFAGRLLRAAARGWPAGAGYSVRTLRHAGLTLAALALPRAAD